MEEYAGGIQITFLKNGNFVENERLILKLPAGRQGGLYPLDFFLSSSTEAFFD